MDAVKEQCLLRAVLETNQEYIALTREMTSVLPKLNFEVKTLPDDIKESLDKVVAILKAEKILQFDETAICVAKDREIIAEQARQLEEKRLLQRHNKLRGDYAKLLKKLNHLEDAIHSIEDATAACKNDDLYCNRMFLSAKLKEYQKMEEKLESDLNDMEVQELYPDMIMTKYKLYLELLSNLADVKRFFEPYCDLPPNLTVAKLMLESKRKEFEELEHQIYGKMND